MGFVKGGYPRVKSVDQPRNRITVVRDNGATVTYSPARLQGIEVFREEQRIIAAGERVQFRAPQRELGIPNGSFATVVAIDRNGAQLRFDDGRTLNARQDQPRHLDYGYAATSHSSQGATVDRVIVNVDTSRSIELVNRKQFYVSISRARTDLTLYTDDRQSLRAAVNRNREKSLALEHLRMEPAQALKQTIEPHPALGRGFSMGR